MSCKTQDDNKMDPFLDKDPWMVQDAKGRAKPAPVVFGDFMPPGFAQIEPSSEKPEVVKNPFGGPYTEEFAKIEETLEESLSENDRRELALRRAISASVPWRRHDLNKMAQLPSKFKFGVAPDKCSCSDSRCSSHDSNDVRDF